jgi:hypothetical protein
MLRKIFLISIILTINGFGQIPERISYQGILTDNNGDPVSDNNYSVTFSLFDASTNGSEIWFEAESISTNNGLFNTTFGDGTSFISQNVDFSIPYWLQIKVDGTGELNLGFNSQQVLMQHLLLMFLEV